MRKEYNLALDINKYYPDVSPSIVKIDVLGSELEELKDITFFLVSKIPKIIWEVLDSNNENPIYWSFGMI